MESHPILNGRVLELNTGLLFQARPVRSFCLRYPQIYISHTVQVLLEHLNFLHRSLIKFSALLPVSPDPITENPSD